MTQLTYQATSLRSLVKLMLPSAESKNFSESQMMSFGIEEQNVKGSDGSMMHQHVLYAESTHPTFLLLVSSVLATDEVESDGVTLRVNSRDLDSALSSFGQQMVTLRRNEQGCLVLTSRPAVDENDREIAPVKTITVQAEVDNMYELPQHTGGLAVLTSMMPLLDGLKSAVGIASVRGNRLDMQGVRITLSPESLQIEGANPSVNASVKYDNAWQKAPRHSYDVTLSTDAVRHLIAALSAYGTSAPVYLDIEDDILCVYTDGVHMEAVMASCIAGT